MKVCRARGRCDDEKWVRFDAQGQAFTADQVGTVKGTTRAGENIVDFDGYEAERADLKAFRELFKNASIVEPWVGQMPAPARTETRTPNEADSERPARSVVSGTHSVPVTSLLHLEHAQNANADGREVMSE